MKRPIGDGDHLEMAMPLNFGKPQTISSITNVSARSQGIFTVNDVIITGNRITARRKYHSPGTVSCQDFAPPQIPVQTKPYFTPG